MTPKTVSSALLSQLRALVLSSPRSKLTPLHTFAPRFFSTTSSSRNWLLPGERPKRKQHKGRAQVNIGGSIRGTTLAYGSWGIRLKSLGSRIPSKNFKIAEETIKRRLKGEKYTLYPRVTCNIAVYTSGNDQRMGKGKGGFDYWAARVSHGRVALEIEGNLHEHVVKDAFRLAGNKLPGLWEFITKDSPPVVGSTKMIPSLTKEQIWRPKRVEPLHPLHQLPDGTRAGDVVNKTQSA